MQIGDKSDLLKVE